MAKKFSMYSDLALGEPIVVTKNGRDRLVILGVDEFNFLQEMLHKSAPAEKKAVPAARRRARAGAAKQAATKD
jgi:PHD/YefM family antitoxin component YafN of YafNO toxin-antitoxin module